MFILQPPPYHHKRLTPCPIISPLKKVRENSHSHRSHSLSLSLSLSLFLTHTHAHTHTHTHTHTRGGSCGVRDEAGQFKPGIN